MKSLVIIGGGFAGFWSAVSAVRQAEALGRRREVGITLVSRDQYLSMRPRFYEPSLEGLQVPLGDYCGPLGIALVTGEVTGIDPSRRAVRLAGGAEELAYDALILAAGSRLKSSTAAGLEAAFNVDTLSGAAALHRHLKQLAASGFETEGARNIVVLGGGLTGLEVVTVLPDILRGITGGPAPVEAHLVEQLPRLAPGYSGEARELIERRLEEAGIHLHLGEEAVRLEPGRLVLESGNSIECATVINTSGLEASPLTANFAGARDRQGRLQVDPYLRVPDHQQVLAAGDAARALVDGEHYAVMSCQHAMPQGKFAGHNAVNLLLGQELLAYAQPRYVTCMDLGAGQGLFTTGWERSVKLTGEEAKQRKDFTMRNIIYPPRDMDETLRMSTPEVMRG